MRTIIKHLFLSILLLSVIPATAQDSKIFDTVDQMPSFPEGKAGLMRFLSSNIHYPQDAEKGGIQGRVICTFVVETDGSISNITVKTPVFPSLNAEAVRCISTMPKWTPGILNGMPVRVQYTLPITFKLNSAKAIAQASSNNPEIQEKVAQTLARQNSLLRQLMSFSQKAITNNIEKDATNKYVRNYYNDDCIDYTLIRGTDRIYTLHEGKTTISQINEKVITIDPSKNGQNIVIFPGEIVDKKKLESIVYAMPVKNGTETRCKSQIQYYGRDSVAINTFYFMLNPGDIIYATRSGVACQDIVNNKLFIYHDDGSIAVYTNISKVVKHKDRVIAGQPVGTLAEGKKSTRLTILYLDKSSMKNTTNVQFPYTSYSPVFRTTQGDVHIDGDVKLTPNTDDELCMQEMTSKEKKKLLSKEK